MAFRFETANERLEYSRIANTRYGRIFWYTIDGVRVPGEATTQPSDDAANDAVYRSVDIAGERLVQPNQLWESENLWLLAHSLPSIGWVYFKKFPDGWSWTVRDNYGEIYFLDEERLPTLEDAVHRWWWRRGR